MFNLFKKNKPIRFVNTVPGIAEAHPVILAKDLKRKWTEQNIKDLQAGNEKIKKCPVGQIKEVLVRTNFIIRCPGIKTFINTGFIMPSPVDFVIETNGDGENFKSEILSILQYGNFGSKELSPIRLQVHLKEQFHNYTPVPRNSLRHVIKLVTGWNVIPDKRYVYLITPPHYGNEDRFTSATGILDPFYDTQINTIMYWHVLNGKEIVKAGTPLLQIIPIPRNLVQPELSAGAPTEEEMKKLKSAVNIIQLHSDRDIRKLKEANERIFTE